MMGKLSRGRVPSDVVVYSLSYLPPNSRFSLNKEHRNSPTTYLTDFYQKISKKPKYSHLFRDWVFNDESCSRPCCEAVKNGYDLLAKCNMLEWVDQEYIITKGLSEFRKGTGEVFDKKDRRLLEEIAKEFAKYSKLSKT